MRYALASLQHIGSSVSCVRKSVCTRLLPVSVRAMRFYLSTVVHKSVSLVICQLQFIVV
jgi:hypothetical protein